MATFLDPSVFSLHEQWSGSKNTNAAYLLLIGDDEENREVLAWWKECEAAGWNRR